MLNKMFITRFGPRVLMCTLLAYILNIISWWMPKKSYCLQTRQSKAVSAVTFNTEFDAPTRFNWLWDVEKEKTCNLYLEFIHFFSLSMANFVNTLKCSLRSLAFCWNSINAIRRFPFPRLVVFSFALIEGLFAFCARSENQ